MNLKRAFFIALAACILPGAALAQDLGTEVRFQVTKTFADGNPAPVMVKLECNDGFVSQDGMAEITADGIGHTFIVTELTPLAPVICQVTEGEMAGYSSMYYATSSPPGEDDGVDADMCEYVYEGRQPAPLDSGAGSAKTEDDHVGVNAIDMGLFNTCNIQNTPDYVGIKVSKDWDITNSGGNVIDMYAEIDVFARGYMMNGYKCERPGGVGTCRTLTFIGENPADQTVSVRPDYKGVVVNFNEDSIDSYIETENDCKGSVTVKPGDNSESCAFMNSVFFEGIPTLSQYGMTIMALLMLGVGFIGFRRFI